MAIKINCKKCGCTEGYLRTGDVHHGIYCLKCNKWIRWVSKAEYDLIFQNCEQQEEGVDIESLEKQRDELNRKIQLYYKNHMEDEILHNNKFIGKVYKRAITKEIMGYYKILDVERNNQYRMKTLVFKVPINPFIDEEINNETTLLSIESIGWFCTNLTGQSTFNKEIDSYTEISNEEYSNAFIVFNDIINTIMSTRP